ncbi:unnamed protein product [Rotaria sordida]|uniref:LAA1-like C-terminal TPR repeats domain-containing protein n=1 Tax=Rotaria sordida TaxID=392033 RepID=A0A814GG04_9BILA|nr:unnamed protein product [Rotaria sordida]
MMINKGFSDNGHFVQCLTSLIINSTSIDLTDECIDFYRTALNDEKTETHIRIYQCINQLFQCTNIPIRNQFIQIFTPILLNELKKYNEDQQQEYIIEILKCFETLLTIVDSTLRIRLASLIIPLFINFLPDSTVSAQKFNQQNLRLISYIIERIQYLIPIYSNEFRIILQTLPDLRTKLENAIRRQQQFKQQQKDEKESNYISKHYNLSMNTSSQAPSLPLRIDFSNFKSS